MNEIRRWQYASGDLAIVGPRDYGRTKVVLWSNGMTAQLP